MEALNFLKFWKPTIPFPTPVIEIRDLVADEEEDSFFELESLKLSPETRTSAMDYPKPSLCLSPIHPIPKRKVLPLEPPPKPHPQPQSPIALLKSAPNFRAFSFKKSKSKSTATESPPILLRESSFRNQERASKDVIRRYIRLVKPLYVKVSKRCHGSSVSELFAPSPSCSPATERSSFRGGCKHLGKSKSTTNSSSSAATASSSGRRDDSLLQHDDGIQSAILHCKRSFSSSRDSCSLSRSASDSSSMKSCSIDAYRISHSASEPAHDYSARNSVEDGRVSV